MEEQNEQQANVSEVTNETVLNEEKIKEEETFRYAGFWMRFWAYMIDVIIVASINGILLSPLLFVNDGYPIEISFWTLNGILSAIVYYVYFLIMTKIFSQTLGKMILGLKVVGENDQPLQWSDLFFREVIGRFLHNVFLVLKLLYLVVAFSKDKQGIHDMLGNTRVIHV